MGTSDRHAPGGMIDAVILVTSCPDCKTTFRISVGILEKAGGQVRCGRCARIFDANVKLREVDESEVEARPAPAFKFQLQPDPEIDSQAEPFAAIDDAPPDDAGDEAPEPAVAAPESDDESPAAMSLPESDGAPAEAGDAAAPDDEVAGADDTPAEEDDALAEADKTPPAPDGEQTEPDDTRPEPDSEAIAAAGTHATGRQPEPEGEAQPEHIVLETLSGTRHSPAACEPPAAEESSDLPDWLRADVEPKPPRTRLWAAGVALATVTLVGQLVHHYREQLAAQPAIGPMLTIAYAGFGTELRLSADLDQYELRDLTAVAEPSGEDQGWLVIETRVHNSGPAVQPYPHIFVRLLDRWEDTVAARYFAPEEYAVTSIGDTDRMNAGSTVDAQFIIMDPGPSATGFELELCIESARGFECESDIVDE